MKLYSIFGSEHRTTVLVGDKKKYSTLEGIIQVYPFISCSGFKWSKYMLAFQPISSEERKQVLADKCRFQSAKQFVTQLEKTKRVTARSYSYNLKHVAEKYRDNTYVSNGILILAALSEGFICEPIERQYNCVFNMSVKSIKKATNGALKEGLI